MKIFEEGHKYALPNKENPKEFQVINFINKQLKVPGGTELYVKHDGTTTEAVLEMVLDRLNHLNARVASEYNANAIIHVRAALDSLNARTKDREQRKVEGTEEK